jgi:hypothetical protein
MYVFISYLASIIKFLMLLNLGLTINACVEIYIHKYHLCFIPEGIAEIYRTFLRDTHVLPKLLSYKEYCRCDR